MNPYVTFALAMCAIVLLSLIGTAWLAARFNRAAKRDLQAALTPLADLTEGTIELEEARVNGRYRDHLVVGQVANAQDGPGRVFRVEVVDAAGGQPWVLTNHPARRSERPPERRFESPVPTFEADLGVDWSDLVSSVSDPIADRYRLEYEPEGGTLRFSRPMRARRDIPPVESFQSQLDMLVRLGQFNRKAQGAPDADWAGGRSPRQTDTSLDDAE